MKRCWFGGGLLLALLVAGLLLSRFLGDFHLELSSAMASAAALTGEHREQAGETVSEVRSRWERRRLLTAVLSDHAPMEEIEEDFRLLTPEAEAEDYRETCLRVAARLKALAEAQGLSLENLL